MKTSAGHTILDDRYELGEELGRGGAGAVYSARDRMSDRPVAIKIFDTPDFSPGFAHPALIHDHIVAIHEEASGEGNAYVVMEKIDGHDLRRYLTPGRLLPLHVTLSIMTRVADALEFAQRHGVMHGDIKPSNILYGARGDVVKVVDFGARGQAAASALTRCGTIRYMSPEQVCGSALDCASDQFSFGVTLYELACGALPFERASLPELLFTIVHEKHVDVREHNAALPATFANLLDRLLAKQAHARFLTAGEVAVAMR